MAEGLQQGGMGLSLPGKLQAHMASAAPRVDEAGSGDLANAR